MNILEKSGRVVLVHIFVQSFVSVFVHVADKDAGFKELFKKKNKKKIAFSSNYQYKSSLCDDRYYECGTSSNNSRLAYCRFNILFFLFIRFIIHPRYRHLFDASFFWVPQKKKKHLHFRL